MINFLLKKKWLMVILITKKFLSLILTSALPCNCNSHAKFIVFLNSNFLLFLNICRWLCPSSKPITADFCFCYITFNYLSPYQHTSMTNHSFPYILRCSFFLHYTVFWLAVVCKAYKVLLFDYHIIRFDYHITRVDYFHLTIH